MRKTPMIKQNNKTRKFWLGDRNQRLIGVCSFGDVYSEATHLFGLMKELFYCSRGETYTFTLRYVHTKRLQRTCT